MKPRFPLPPPLLRLALGLAALLVCAGCNRSDDQITVYRIPKETPTPAAPQPAAPGGAAPLAMHWTAPAGWEEQAPSGFRKGSFLVTGADGKKADVSVISFPEAAGGLLANVNRWRDQLKLAPITDVVKAGTPMEVAGRDMFFVELLSEEPLSPDGSKSRILGGIFPAGPETWFFKMIGPDALVDSQREAFKQFLQSVHPAEGDGAGGHTHAPASANSGGADTIAPTAPLAAAAPGAAVRYTLPAGWQEKPLSPMRLASFKATAPNGKEADISVVALAGNGRGRSGQREPLARTGAARADR